MNSNTPPFPPLLAHFEVSSISTSGFRRISQECLLKVLWHKVLTEDALAQTIILFARDRD